MPKVHFVKAARKDNAVCKKGESYYWWKFRYGAKRFSKTHPRRSELTQSAFLGTIYDIEERIQAVTINDDFGDFISDIVNELQDLQSDCESSLDSIPDQLREGPSGALLQERIDEVDNMINDLEAIDTSVDIEREDYENEEEYKQALEDRKQNIVDEISEISYSGS